MRRRILPLVLVVFAAGCQEGRVSAPTPIIFPPAGPPVVRRTITFSGSLAFGTVDIGQSASLVVRVENSGNDTVRVTGITSPVGFRVDWSTGTIAAGSSADLTVTFAPEDARIYNGLVIVSGDLTGGDNRVNVTGTGRVP